MTKGKARKARAETALAGAPAAKVVWVMTDEAVRFYRAMRAIELSGGKVL